MRGTGGNYCTTINRITTIVLRKAKTADIIYQETFYGAGGCSETEEFAQNQKEKAVYAQDVTPEVVWNSIKGLALNPYSAGLGV